MTAQQPQIFHLQRDRDISGVSGTGRVANGVLWPDGTVTLRWLGERPSTVHWNRLADAIAVHGHGGATRLVWATPQPPAVDQTALRDRIAEAIRTPCSIPECDADGTGEPCDRHEREESHAEGDHSGCGVECEAIIPTEHLRNMLLYRALPGAKSALAELERRAAAGARQDGTQP